MAKKEKLQIIISAKDAASATLKKLDHAFSGMKRSLAGLSHQIFSLKGALAGLGLGLTARDFLKTAESFEALRTRLETITGSAAKAEKAMSWITDFAARTPYEIEQVADAFTKLSAYGIDASRNIGVLGDTAAAMGKSLDQAVEMFADAVTGEFERLKEFGIRASQQGDQVTFRWMQNGRQMVRAAEKTQQGISRALTEILSGRFSGAMERYSKTWKGMWSNLMDQFTRFKQEVMKAGVFDYLKGMLSGLLKKINELKRTGQLDLWAKDMARGVINAINAMIRGFGVLGESIYAVRAAFGMLAEKYYSYEIKQLQKEKERLEKALKPGALWRALYPESVEREMDEANRKRLEQIRALISEYETGRQAGAMMAEDNVKAMDRFRDKIEKVKSFLEGLRTTPPPPPPPGEEAPGKGTPGTTEAKTLSALAKTKSETARTIERARTALKMLDGLNEKGSIKLEEFFRRRKELLDRQFQAEIEYLRKKRDAEKDPERRLAVEDEIFGKEQAHKRALIELADKQAEAERRLAEQKQRISQMLEDIRLRAASTEGAGDLQARFQAEQAEMDGRHREEIERLRSLNAEKAAIDEAYRMQKLEKDKLLADQERRLQEYRLNTAGEVAGGMAQIFSNLYELTGRKQKEFFYLSKAAALAQAIINTAQAATKALAQGGIMGPVMAAVIAAQGAVQIATITAQRLAAGGPVSGISPHEKADNIPIWATAGEWVIPVRAARYYGARVMEAIRTMKMPRSVFTGLSLPAFSPPALPSYSFAGGGQVPAAGAPAGLTIINVTDPREIDSYLAGSEGQDAILNVLSSRAESVKRILY